MSVLVGDVRPEHAIEALEHPPKSPARRGWVGWILDEMRDRYAGPFWSAKWMPAKMLCWKPMRVAAGYSICNSKLWSLRTFVGKLVLTLSRLKANGVGCVRGRGFCSSL